MSDCGRNLRPRALFMSDCGGNLGPQALVDRVRGWGLPAFLAWVVVQSPRVAEACAVCTAGRDEENQAAFLWSTLFMSLLPLIAIGTLVFVIRRRYLKLEAETAARALENDSQAVSRAPACGSASASVPASASASGPVPAAAPEAI